MNTVELHNGDCLAVLMGMPSDSIDAIVTDPPYGLSFMGKRWDYDVPSEDVWRECLRVLKPGGHLLAFAGTRTQHRMAVRIEDAGFEIRDMIAWVYGSGFPKSLDVSKAIDKSHGENRDRQLRFTAWMRGTGITAQQINTATASCMGSHYLTDKEQPAIATADMFDKLRPYLPEVPEEIERLVCERTGLEWTAYKNREVVAERTMTQGGGASLQIRMGERREVEANITTPATDAARQWQGWGTALKPALEPITVARKPLSGTVAETVLKHGTGALNVDGCRVGRDAEDVLGWSQSGSNASENRSMSGANYARDAKPDADGRWPANLIHDGSEEVLAAFPQAPGQLAKASTSDTQRAGQNAYGVMARGSNGQAPRGDAGSAARFFYCAKASGKDRDEGVAGVAGGMSGRRDGSMGSVTMRKNTHPTVKPTDLMRYLCRLVTPPGGIVLDPFMGSGSTGKAAVLEGFRFVGIEREAEYLEIARARIQTVAPVAAPVAPQEPQMAFQL